MYTQGSQNNAVCTVLKTVFLLTKITDAKRASRESDAPSGRIQAALTLCPRVDT